MIEFIMKGGVLIYPIFLSSIIALGVFLEKILSLQTKKVIPPEFLNNLRELVKENKISLALDYCIENDSSMARISIAGLRYFGKDKLEIRYALEEAGRQEVKNLEKYVEVLSTVAAISPLLGLLGTVTGMIKTFSVISLEGVGNPSILASGISEALVATFLGLSVAVSSFVGYKYLIGKLDSLSFKLEEKSNKLIELLANKEEIVI